jgi:hypothetical protein
LAARIRCWRTYGSSIVVGVHDPIRYSSVDRLIEILERF